MVQVLLPAPGTSACAGDLGSDGPRGSERRQGCRLWNWRLLVNRAVGMGGRVGRVLVLGRNCRVVDLAYGWMGWLASSERDDAGGPLTL